MDKYCVKTFQELNNMQSKISSLFQDLLVERYHYKLSSDKLKKNLEEVSMEVRNLKKQNEKLQQGNLELKSVICECIRFFSHPDLSDTNLVKDCTLVDILKRILSQTSNGSPELDEIGLTIKKETCVDRNENPATRCNINQDDIKRETDAIKALKFTTQFFDNVKVNEENDLFTKNQTDMVLEKLFDRKSSEIVENVGKPFFVRETEPFDEKNATHLYAIEVQETVDPLSKVTTPKKNLPNSPVFKDFGNRRPENLSTGENCIDDSRYKINEKLFLKSADIITSPFKKPNVGNSVSPKRNMSSPKRMRKKLKLDSPKKSPVNQLKKSNSREAEISLSGVRKLTQTLLNIECFKKKSPEKRNREENDKNGRHTDPVKVNETKALGDADEDDVIMESPKKLEQVLEDIKNKKKSGSVSNEISSMTPPTTADADLDETYISASVIRKCQVTGKQILEKICEDQTPVKRPNRERSPDCDSVPFIYKREAVRSKTERMKLPGHACLECNKYYKNALGEDISPAKLKEILNKCSRHRDKNSPSHDDTPPGYWKPYLTASVMTSHKDDAVAE